MLPVFYDSLSCGFVLYNFLTGIHFDSSFPQHKPDSLWQARAATVLHRERKNKSRFIFFYFLHSF